jgi:aminoglycoside phosphotransferase
MTAQAGFAELADAGQQPVVRPGELLAALGMPDGRTILLDGSRDPNSGVTLLLVPPGSDEPRLAVKIATTDIAAEVIEREAAVLRELAGRALGQVRGTLPRPAGVFRVDGMLAVAATVVPGVPMRTLYHEFRHLARPQRVRADFAAAQRWLAALQAESAGGKRQVALLDGVAERISARWPGDARAEAASARLGPLASRLSAAAVPQTVVHGDFWAGNLLMTGAQITGVVDWAAGEMSGDPLRDVARFALSYALYLDRHTRPGHAVRGHPGLRADGWGAGIRHAICSDGWFAALVREFVGGALTRLGAPAGLWRDVLLAGIAEVAVTADHPDFAASHLDLLLLLTGEAVL